MSSAPEVRALAHAPLAPGPVLGRAAVVRLRNVSAGYGDQIALRDVDLEIAGGSLLAIFGPNGGGKTTLLKLIAGILAPWSGSIEVLGGPPGVEARQVAYVPRPSSSTGPSR